jgi:hypothetical protein
MTAPENAVNLPLISNNNLCNSEPYGCHDLRRVHADVPTYFGVANPSTLCAHQKKATRASPLRLPDPQRSAASSSLFYVI